MAKQLKWFKFDPASWMMGRIVRENDNIQANFIRLCCQYWFNQCEYSKEDAMLECGEDVIEYLAKKKFIAFDGDALRISFLDEQRDDIEEVSKVRQNAAKERWSKQKYASAMQVNASAYNIDKDKDKDKERDKNKNKNIVPDFEEFKKYALSQKANVDHDALRLKYSSWVENGWRTGNDKQIKNWKTTILNTLPHMKESVLSSSGKPKLAI